MTIKDAIAEAARTNNAKLAGQIADRLRFKMGMNYNEITEMAGRAGVSPGDWESLMEAADSAEAN